MGVEWGPLEDRRGKDVRCPMSGFGSFRNKYFLEKCGFRPDGWKPGGGGSVGGKAVTTYL